MDIERIIKKHFGGSAKDMATAFGVTPGAVSQWRQKLPPRRRDQIDLWLLKRKEPRK